MSWRRDDPQGNESAKISWEIVRYTRGRVLDIGAGRARTFPHFVTVDNNIDAHLFGHQMPRPDVYVETAEKLEQFADNSWDAVFSSHLLEHIPPENVAETLREWLRVVKVGGYLILYLPDEDQYPKVGEEGANPDHKWNVSYEQLLTYMRGTRRSWDLIDYQVRSDTNEYSLYFVFKKLSSQKDDGFHYSHREKTPFQVMKACGRTCAVVRYGAFGDSIQTTAVLAALKAQGYHVTLYAARPGLDAIRNCPYIDDVYEQDPDQVPNAALGQFWEYERKKYDKWVNLCESVEGQLLTMAKFPAHTYSPHVRHMLCDKNYLQRKFEIAEVPYTLEHARMARFYPTNEEMAWARAERAKYGKFLVVWSLAGSSVHKHWPWIDQAISGLLLDFPELELVFVGALEGKILEQGWGKTPRVHCRSGAWSIRETFAFAQTADLVVGAETGVMNSVAMLDMPKVVFLSHSTVENLTRDWVNTHSIASLNTTCKGRGANVAPACHQMHYNWDTCSEAPAPEGTEEEHARKGSGVAQCQFDINAQDAYRVIWHVVQWRMEGVALRGADPRELSEQYEQPLENVELGNSLATVEVGSCLVTGPVLGTPAPHQPESTPP